MFVILKIFLLLFPLLVAVGSQEEDWWKSAVVYQVYPRSFKDSDNSGMGDLRGVIEKLDHFVDAGITAIWFSPIYKSPGVDAGYDISDFRDINEEFGTLDDFKELLQKAHELGLKVILDFVPNHSSDQHEWFQNAVAGDAYYQDYYIWKDVDPQAPNIPPNSWTSYFGGPAWTKVDALNKWYFHQFAPEQPDLNYRNPILVQEMKDVISFWLDMGVDGFRVDIISALFENPDYPDEDEWIHRSDQPETYHMVYEWRALLDEHSRRDGVTRIMMTESYSEAPKIFPYYGNETHSGAHFPFNFWFITDLQASSNARDLKFLIDRWFTYMPKEFIPNWVLGNHDQRRVGSRFGTQRIDGFNMLTMMLPGVAITYNGEEIGMEDGEVSYEDGVDPQGCNAGPNGYEERSRDFERTPYHWDGTVNAGFNTGAKPWLPVSEKYLTNNLEAQKGTDGKSHYKIYKALVALRKTDTLKYGEVDTVALNANVFALTRRLEGEISYLLLINVGNTQQTVSLGYFTYLPEIMRVEIPSMESDKLPGQTIRTTQDITLAPYEAVVIRTNQ